MGIFDIFKKKKAEETPKEIDEVKIECAHLLESVENDLKEELEDVKKTLESLESDAKKEIEKLKDSARKMENVYFEKDDKRYTRINMVKDAWLKKFESALRSLSLDDAKDLDAIEKNASEIEAFLGEISATDMRQNYILSNYFKKEMKSIISSLAILEESAKSLRELAQKSAVKTRKKIRSLAKGLSDARKERKETEEKIKKMENELLRLEEIIKEREKNLSDIVQSPEMKRLYEVTKRKEEAEKRLKELRMRMSEELAVINRPLKKIKHGLEKSDAMLISEFASSPVEICLSPEGERKAETVINIIKKNASEANMSDKDKKKLDAFYEKVKSNELKRFRDEYMETEEALKNMEAEIKESSYLPKRKESVEGDLRLLKEEKEKIETELSEAKKKEEEARKKIAGLEKEIAGYTEENLRKKYIVLP